MRLRPASLLGTIFTTITILGHGPGMAIAAEATVPASLLEREVPLRQGIGNSHEAVSTRSPQAQAFFDQGLDYLEGYVWIEAARSFHQALRLDPDLAMAYVGLSRTESGLGDRAAAWSDLRRAQSLAAKASPRERRRIALREKQLVAMDDPKNARKFQAYKKAIDDALRLDAEPSLWLLRGNAEEPDASGRGQYGTAASIIYYHHILTLEPDHASAHHFLANTYEALGQPDSALAHGEAYARLAPAIDKGSEIRSASSPRVSGNAVLDLEKKLAPTRVSRTRASM